MKAPKHIFLLGTGRTATVFLQRFFSRNFEKTLAVHEPSRIIKLYSNRHLCGRAREGDLERFLRRYARSIAKRMAAGGFRTYVQVDPWLFGFTPLLPKVFDDPVVVHVVRHPFTYIPSHLNRMYKTAAGGWIRDAIPFWKLRGDLAGDFSREEWRALTPEEKQAWYWNACNSFIESKKEGLGRFKLVRYEDLTAPDLSGLRLLAGFCGLSPRFDPLVAGGLERNVAPRRFPAARDWSPATIESVRRTCAPLSSRYGYDLTSGNAGERDRLSGKGGSEAPAGPSRQP